VTLPDDPDARLFPLWVLGLSGLPAPRFFCVVTKFNPPPVFFSLYRAMSG